jgi:hypothetical protein
MATPGRTSWRGRLLVGRLSFNGTARKSAGGPHRGVLRSYDQGTYRYPHSESRDSRGPHSLFRRPVS